MKKKTYGNIDFDPRQKRWFIVCQAHVSLRFKRVFARVSETSYGTHALTDTADNARDLEWFLDRYAMVLTSRAKAHMQRRADEYRERASVVEKLLAGRGRHAKVDLALPLRDYQQTAVAMVRAMKGLLLADELGLGKTLVGIAVIAHADARPALVVAQTHLLTQWVAEFA